MTEKGLLLVISGPSGVGKGSVMKKLFNMRDDLYMSVSAATRQPREGEIQDVSYHFMSREEFLEIKANDGFLENACFCDNYYGTLKSEVFDKINSGINVILEIEVQGAMQVRRKYPEGVFIYILPPSFEELRNRLINRNTESDDVIEKRLEASKWELENIDKYNYLVINDVREKAAERINSIIEAEHLRTARSLEYVKEKINK